MASVFFSNRRETVYNFMVAEFHTYAVGEGVVWTHNESTCLEYLEPEGHGHKLDRKLGQEEGIGELEGGGGRVIARGDSIRDVKRLVSEYGGQPADWVKVSSTAAGHLETHAYRNIATGLLVEIKTKISKVLHNK